MNTAVGTGFGTSSWKDLYQAALLESDLLKMPARISEAEAALVIRARELVYAAENNGEEGESLDDAMCIFRALRSSLKRGPTPVAATNRVNQLMLSAG